MQRLTGKRVRILPPQKDARNLPKNPQRLQKKLIKNARALPSHPPHPTIMRARRRSSLKSEPDVRQLRLTDWIETCIKMFGHGFKIRYLKKVVLFLLDISSKPKVVNQSLSVCI